VSQASVLATFTTIMAPIGYLEKTARIPKLAAKENRSEFVQCLLIAPYSQAITLDDLKKADPKGNKSLYRCYY